MRSSVSIGWPHSPGPAGSVIVVVVTGGGRELVVSIGADVHAAAKRRIARVVRRMTMTLGENPPVRATARRTRERSG